MLHLDIVPLKILIAFYCPIAIDLQCTHSFVCVNNEDDVLFLFYILCIFRMTLLILMFNELIFLKYYNKYYDENR